MIDSRWDAEHASVHELAHEHQIAVDHGDEEKRDVIQEEALSRGISIPQLEEMR